MQHKAHRQRQIKEDMGQNHAMQSIDFDLRQAEYLQPLANPAIAPENGQQTHHRHDHRQHKRGTHQRNHSAAAHETAPRQSACNGDGQQDTHQR